VNHKEACKELLKVIYRKIQAFETEENKENDGAGDKTPAPPAAKARSYSSNSPTSPSWAKGGALSSPTATSSNGRTAPSTVPIKSRYQPWTKPEQPTQAPPPPKSYGGGFRRGGPVDLAKVGVQMGKTKVFLRHKAFETLERIRSRDLTSAATKLNAIFRMYLSRMAYVPVRDALREELRSHGLFIDYKETKEDDLEPNRPRAAFKRSSSTASHLIYVYESEVRASIHNPTPRSEWGNEAPKKLFKWVLLEGIWVKNHSIGPEVAQQ
jgi:hypothetical protein